MTTLLTAIYAGIIGLFLGSFAGAHVWRLRASQLRSDAEEGEKVPARDKRQVAKLQRKSVTRDRSVCLHCGHQLEWYDLIPLVSWVSLRGKCRYCHKAIGTMEPIIELTMALFFAISVFFWPSPLTSPLEIIRLILWLAAGVGLAILTVYDAKWFLLPNKVVFPLVGIGAVSSFIVIWQQRFSPMSILDVVTACTVLSGLYYVIYVGSKHQWVGFGDVKLGLALALLLAEWRLALLALFLANLIGAVLVIPMMFFGRMDRKAHIPFGPLLIAGWLIAGLFGGNIIAWYLSLSLGAV